MGFTSSNDERFLPAIKFIGLLDTTGKPTELWTDAKANLGKAIAKGVVTGYDKLFQQFPNANQKDEEALRTYFSVNSGLGAPAVSKMVATFRAFCEIGDFSSVGNDVIGAKEQKTIHNPQPSPQNQQPSEAKIVESGGAAPSVVVNIQLELPSDPTGEVYEKFFSAMKKYINP